MSYLKDFLKHIASHDYPAFLKIWEEYCAGDEPDGEELIQVLKSAKNATFIDLFGKDLEKGLPLLQYIKDEKLSHEVFRLIIDMETSQNPELGQKAFDYLQNRYGNDKHFNEKIRLIGLRNKEKFQGAISNYELLSHINKGKFVFHTAGWGVGMVVDYSLTREQLVLEFDYVAGKKDLSFDTAFKTLIPLPEDHFLAQRFGNPDALEKKAKEDPVHVIRILLQDLGPKTAGEIKDELCDLVIPAKEWTKWWQSARSKVKKDTFIETPEDIRSSFKLRNTEVTHEEKLQKALDTKPDASTLIQMVHSFVKDFGETLKNEEFKSNLSSKLEEVLSYPEISEAQKFQIHLFLQDLKSEKKAEEVDEIISKLDSPEEVLKFLNAIEILAFKKRALVEIRKLKDNWAHLFLEIFLLLDQSTLRDYVLSELIETEGQTAEVKAKLEKLCNNPSEYPEIFVWYFQKIMNAKKAPLLEKGDKARFFESFLILLSHIEHSSSYKELTKKMHSIISEGRYAIVRQMMQEAKINDVKEFLLLATKCHSFEDHDIKVLHSLAEVAHPSLTKEKKRSSSEQDSTIWTTEAGYLKLQERIKQIATVETVDNAKEIETARGHGDLRENAEFKAALERRDRLQSDMKLLSSQLSKARVITAQDISTDHVGIGTIVTCKNSKGEEAVYTLLGPWDADPEKNILTFQSKLAQAMKGHVVGDSFTFQEDAFTIKKIASYL